MIVRFEEPDRSDSSGGDLPGGGLARGRRGPLSRNERHLLRSVTLGYEFGKPAVKCCNFAPMMLGQGDQIGIRHLTMTSQRSACQGLSRYRRHLIRPEMMIPQLGDLP